MDMTGFCIPQEDMLPFVKCMAVIARADGDVTEEERQAIESAMMAWGIQGEDESSVQKILNHGGDVTVFIKEFTQPKTAYLLIQELITLANIDGQYDNLEKSVVKKIAESADISSTRLDVIEDWVNDGILWRKRGLELLEPEA